MKKTFAILATLLCLSTQAQQYGVSTVAGVSSAFGFAGDGGQATAATFWYPPDVTIDALGNFYIVDYFNGRIRKVNISTGIITTIAGGGTPTPPSIGDGGQATAAGLDGPISIAIDASGNIFIAELNASRIRRIDGNTGTITTVAGTGTAGFSGDGGLATAAQFQNPRGIALDSQGNLYVADWFNSRIRKINTTTGIITTVAGGGSPSLPSYGDGGLATLANLFYPRDVAIDAQDNFYIADEQHARVRKVNSSTGIISTFAGGGSPIYPATGEGGPATAAIITAACLAFDAQNNLYIGGGNRIRKVNATTGLINTIAGSDTAGFAGDGGGAITARFAAAQGMAVNAQGNVYIADYSNNRVRKLTSCTVPVATASQYSVCAGTGLTLSVSGMVSYTWSSGANTASTNVIPITNTTYSVNGKDNIGCPSMATINIQTYTLPIISVNNATVCPAAIGNSIVLVPSGAITYSITGGSFTVNPNATTSYSVTGTDSNGCLSSNTAVSTVLVVNTLPSINITGNDTICADETTLISASGVNSYTWTYASDNGQMSSYGANIIVSPNVGTTYSVQGTDVYGCVGGNTSISLYVNTCTGIDENKMADFKIYPNPTKDILHLENINANEELFVVIFDMYGRVVQQTQVQREINIQDLETGLYVLQLRTKNKDIVHQQKLIKE